MSLSGSDKALMYAIGGVARGGATRGGYVSPKTFVKVAGVQRANDKFSAPHKIEDLSLHLGVNEIPDTLTFTAFGWTPLKGSDVEVTIGSINRIKKEFAGKALTVTRTIPNLNGIAHYAVNAIDTTWGLNDQKVSARYTATTIAAVAADLIATYAPTYTVQVDAIFGALTLDEISFTNQDLTDALTQLVNRGGGYWDCDYANVVRLYETDTSRTAPVALTATHVSLEQISVEEDLSQFFTRVFVEGRGSTAAATVNAGETILPLVSIAPLPSSGLFASGPQRCSYTGRTEVAPSNGPAVVAVAGTGLAAASNYLYAQTFTTGSGETSPSPVSSVTTGVTAAPATAPVLGSPTGGGSVDFGTHDYEVTFGTATGDTTPSPVSSQQTTTTLAPPTAPTIFNDSPGGIGYGPATGWPVAGDTVRIGYTAVVAGGGETTPTLSNAIVAQDAGFGNGSIRDIFLGVGFVPTLPPGASDMHVYLHINGAYNGKYYATSQGLSAGLGPVIPSNGSPPGVNTAVVKTIPLSSIPVGGSDVTNRKLWRRFNSTGTFKLVVTLNATATTYNDTTANASLGAAAPSSNTAVTQRVAVTLTIGPVGTTGRNLYRTIAFGSQLKRVTAVADNTTTTYTDSTADGSLGVNAPTSDTSGFNFTGFALTSGATAIGATTLVVDSATPFITTGGWVRVGDLTLRYTGKTTTTLTGIPAFGTGAITTAIPTGTLVQGLVALTGIPASGVGSIRYGITVGDEVNLVAQVDDVPAQALLAGLIGGTGIREDVIQDRRISYAEAVNRGRAYLDLRALVRLTIGYTVKDLRTNGSSTIDINLPGAPVDVVGSFKVIDVTIDTWQQNIYPLRHVKASTERFSLEDLLRRQRDATS